MFKKNLSWLYNSWFWRKLTEGYYKDIPDYEGLYQINRYGSVKSLSRVKFNGTAHYISKEIILKSVINRGHKRVVLRKNNKSKTIKVALLVFRTFKPNTLLKYGEIINHVNNIKIDNHIYNLRILSQRQNCSKYSEGYSSRYVGVYWSNTQNKWIASIHINKADRYLGTFNNELKAAKMYQLAVKNVSKFKDPKQFREYIKRAL